MKPSTRWTIVVFVAIVLGIIWLLWPKPMEPPAPAKAPVAPPPMVAKPEPKAEPKPEPTPAVTPTAEEPVTATVLFDFDKSAVRAGEAPKLDELAAKVKGRTFDRLEVVGHADRIGTNAYNMGLSKRRAEAVQAYLTGKGIEAGRTRADAKGENEAVTGDACKGMGQENRKNQKLIACLQRDRRVEISLVAPR